MKTGVLLLLIYSFCSFPLTADELSSPQVLLEKAKKGRAEFLLVVQDIERLSPTLPAKEQLFPYINILNELEEIALGHGVDEISNQIVKKLGWVLTRQGIKWLRLDQEPTEFITQFFSWSENSTRYQIAGQHLKLLVLVSDKNGLLLWYQRAYFSLETIMALKSEAYVIEAFEQLQANCVQRLIKIKNEIAPDEMIGILKSVRSLIAIQSIIGFLNEEVLKANNHEELETCLRWGAILSENFKRLNQTIPFNVLTAPGYLIITIVSKILTQEKVFEVELVAPLVSSLMPSQVPELGSILISLYRDKQIPEAQLMLLVELSAHLLEEYKKMGLNQPAEEMKKFLSRVSLLEAGVSQEIEGSYEVTVRDKPGLLNFVHIGNGKFFIGLSVRYGGEVSADFSFFQVTYNSKKEEWEAVHYDVSDPNFSNPVNEVFFMKFNIKSEGGEKIFQGTFFTSKLTSPVIGKKTKSYLSFSEKTRQSIPDVSGVYLGETREVKFRLVLYQSAQRLQGTLLVTYKDNIPVTVTLEYGYYDPKRNTVYLSSGMFESQRWVHIRGEFFDEGKRFEGQYIQSVYGVLYEVILQPELTR